MLVKLQHTYLRISEKSYLLTKANNIQISEKYLSTKAASTHISEKSYLSLSRKFSFQFYIRVNIFYKIKFSYLCTPIDM